MPGRPTPWAAALMMAMLAALTAFARASPSGELVETVEIPNHPFYVGVQFHPEFKSRPNRAHPLFKAFIAASKKRSFETYENES